MGWFSSDRAVREYADKVWDVNIDRAGPLKRGFMETLFIGQTYIDVTFLADHMPQGDEKSVASEYAVRSAATRSRRRSAAPSSASSPT